MAKRGFTVVGRDYSELLIEKAKGEARKAGVSVEFARGDMRQLPFKEEFDVVLMLFTAFGYFDDETNQKVLREINKALKPEGRFLIDAISGEAVMKRFSKDGVQAEER